MLAPAPPLRLPHPLSLLSVLPDKRDQILHRHACPALPWPWPPDGAYRTPPEPMLELLSHPNSLLLAKDPSKAYRAGNVLNKIKAPRRELKRV